MAVKKYEPAEMKITPFEAQDILTTSNSSFDIIDRPPDDGNDDMF